MVMNVPVILLKDPTSRTMTVSPRRRAALAILASSVATFGVGSHSCLAGGHQHGPVYRTLDTLAGGIESAIDVARGVTNRCVAVRHRRAMMVVMRRPYKNSSPCRRSQTTSRT